MFFLSGCGISDDILVSNVTLQANPPSKSPCTCTKQKTPAKTVETETPVKEKVISNNEKIPVTVKNPEKPPDAVPVTDSKPKKIPLEQIIDNTKLAYSKIISSQVEMYTYSKGEYKDGKKTGQTRETFETGKITIKNPGTIMIEISDSDDPLAKNSKLLYTGSGKVKVKGGGFLGIIPVSFDISDPKLSNSRNQGLTSLTEHINRLTGSGTDLKLLGTSTISGKKVYMIRSENPKLSDPEISYEIFAIDAKEFFLISNEMYKKDELVSQYIVKSFTLNPTLSADFFTL